MHKHKPEVLQSSPVLPFYQVLLLTCPSHDLFQALYIFLHHWMLQTSFEGLYGHCCSTGNRVSFLVTRFFRLILITVSNIFLDALSLILFSGQWGIISTAFIGFQIPVIFSLQFCSSNIPSYARSSGNRPIPATAVQEKFYFPCLPIILRAFYGNKSVLLF